MLILSNSQAKSYIKRHRNDYIHQEQELFIQNNRVLVGIIGYHGWCYKILARVRKS